MKHRRLLAFSLVILLVLLVSALSVHWTVNAQQDDFTLKVDRHWDPSGQSGICVHGGYNLAIADLNGNGLKEIVTGGFLYYVLPNGSETGNYAPIEIWSWNGTDITLLANCTYPGNTNNVYTADLNGDGKPELITTGSVTNSSGSYPSLRIWTLDGANLTLKASYEGIRKSSIGPVFVSDVNGDGTPEIIAVGSSNGTAQSAAQLFVFRFDGNNLTLLASVSWNAHALSVSASDLNYDGKPEIVTAGYSNLLNDSKGELRVWQYDEGNLTLKSNADWSMVDGAYSVDIAGNVMGNTVASIVKIADVDGDGVPEIVTGGFTYNGTSALSQVRIWNWSGETLNLEKSQEWSILGINQASSLAVGDVNGDYKMEIVTSGCTAGYGSFAPGSSGKPQSTMEVWRWDGVNLTLLQKKEWVVGTGDMAWAVGTADLENNGVTEIVTAGCAQINNVCDPDLRIWALPVASVSSMPFAPSIYNVLLVVGLAAIAVAAIALIALVRMKKMPIFIPREKSKE